MNSKGVVSRMKERGANTPTVTPMNQRRTQSNEQPVVESRRKKKSLNKVRVTSAIIIGVCALIVLIGCIVTITPTLYNGLMENIIAPFINKFGFWSAGILGSTVFVLTIIFESIRFQIRKIKIRRRKQKTNDAVGNFLPHKKQNTVK